MRENYAVCDNPHHQQFDNNNGTDTSTTTTHNDKKRTNSFEKNKQTTADMNSRLNVLKVGGIISATQNPLFLN